MSPIYQAPYAVMKLRFFRNHKHTQQLSPIHLQRLSGKDVWSRTVHEIQTHRSILTRHDGRRYVFNKTNAFFVLICDVHSYHHNFHQNHSHNVLTSFIFFSSNPQKRKITFAQTTSKSVGQTSFAKNCMRLSLGRNSPSPKMSRITLKFK